VIRRGRVIAEAEPRRSRLAVEGRPAVVDAASYAPPG
jgi:cytosine deaminase